MISFYTGLDNYVAGCTMQGAVVKNPSASGRRMRRPGKEELRGKLQGLISEIAMHKVEDHVKTNEKLKRITSLEISLIKGTSEKKELSIDDVIAEMEAEMERLD